MQIKRAGRSCLAPAQHENNQHDYHDDDYGTDTDIHRLFLSWQRPVSIDDEVPGAIFRDWLRFSYPHVESQTTGQRWDAAAGGTHVKVKSPLLDDAPPTRLGKG